MRRPRFALSIMLGAMAASISALGFPPVSNSPVAVGGAPNAALICPVSSLAAESHPFHWFERSEAGPTEVAVDNWLLTIRAHQIRHDAVPSTTEPCDAEATPRRGCCRRRRRFHSRSELLRRSLPLGLPAQLPRTAAECTPQAMSLDACDLSIGECEEEYETARSLALELCWTGLDRRVRRLQRLPLCPARSRSP